MSNYLVIDIGGTFTKYAVMDEKCQFIRKDKTPTVKTDLPAFLDMLEDIYRKNSDVEGIAISSAGMIDSEKGYMYNGGSLFFIENLNLTQVLEERCGVRVTVENDARSAGLAEIWKGALADCRNAAAMILGTAVGGAIIVDRKVLCGKHCFAGEFSYLLTNAREADRKENILAECGGVPALIRIASKKMGLPLEELNGEVIFEKANQGDPTAIDCVREYAHTLAVQINNLQFVFDPEKVAIGGGVSAQPLLLDLIREELNGLGKVYPYTVPVPEIVNCQFFNDSNLIGALYSHLQKANRI